jgi:hypothetical protein
MQDASICMQKATQSWTIGGLAAFLIGHCYGNTKDRAQSETSDDVSRLLLESVSAHYTDAECKRNSPSFELARILRGVRKVC